MHQDARTHVTARRVVPAWPAGRCAFQSPPLQTSATGLAFWTSADFAPTARQNAPVGQATPERAVGAVKLGGDSSFHDRPFHRSMSGESTPPTATHADELEHDTVDSVDGRASTCMDHVEPSQR